MAGGLMADQLNLIELADDGLDPIEDANQSISESSVNSLFLHEFWEDYKKKPAK